MNNSLNIEFVVQIVHKILAITFDKDTQHFEIVLFLYTIFWMSVHVKKKNEVVGVCKWCNTFYYEICFIGLVLLVS